MAGHEGNGGPTLNEEENHDDKNGYNNMQDEDQEAQENDDAQTGETMNDAEVNEDSIQEDIVTETSVTTGNNVVLPNPEDETDGAQVLENEDAEIAQPAQAGLSPDIITEDPDASPDLEEELGGVIIGEIEYANGLVDLLVISIDSSLGIPELI